MCGSTTCTHHNNISKLQSSSSMSNSNHSNPIAVQAKLLAVPTVTAVVKKHVTFHSTVQVMLIPCIQEYRDAKIFDSIWWEPCDFRTFQVDLSIAFKKFMQKTTCSDLKEALKLFILDELECGDESNQNFSPLKRSREPSPIIPSETMMPLAKRAKV